MAKDDQRRQSWRLIDVLTWASSWFETKNIPHPRRDAEQLLAPILHCKRIELYMYHDRLLSQEELATYKNYITQRAQRVPLAYIVGTTEFYGYEFDVGPGVLVPRPETEVLVEQALALQPVQGARVLDIGTGSGNIACSIALERDDVHVTAFEASPEAYVWAERNIKKHRLETRIDLHLMDFVEEDCSDYTHEKFDLVLANPPYIAQGDIEGLESEVRDYEPRMALIGGATGAELPTEQLHKVRNYIKSDGALFMEIGSDQGEIMKEISREQFPQAKISILNDLTGRDRILHIKGGWHG